MNFFVHTTWAKKVRLVPPLNQEEVLSWIENNLRSRPEHGKTITSGLSLAFRCAFPSESPGKRPYEEERL